MSSHEGNFGSEHEDHERAVELELMDIAMAERNKIIIERLTQTMLDTCESSGLRGGIIAQTLIQKAADDVKKHYEFPDLDKF